MARTDFDDLINNEPDDAGFEDELEPDNAAINENADPDDTGIEGDNEPDDDGQPGDANEADVFVLPYENEDGEIVEEEIPLEDVGDIIRNARVIASRAAEVDAAWEEAQEAMQYKPLLEFVKGDAFLQQIMQYRIQNVSERDIAQHLYEYFEEQKDMGNSDNSGFFDESAQGDNKLSDYEKRLSAFEQKQQQQEVAQHNQGVFQEAFQAVGVTGSITAEQRKAIETTYNELYPTFDPRTQKLTKRQAETVLREAGIKPQQAATAVDPKKNLKPIIKSAQQSSRSAKAPEIMGATRGAGSGTGQGSAPRSQPKVDGVNRSERSKRLSQFI